MCPNHDDLIAVHMLSDAPSESQTWTSSMPRSLQSLRLKEADASM
jgi:hypothetical protein